MACRLDDAMQQVATEEGDKAFTEEKYFYRRASCQLVQWGFKTKEQLEGLTADETTKMLKNPMLSSLVVNIAGVMARKAKVKRQRRLETALAAAAENMKENRIQLNSKQVGDKLDNSSRSDRWTELQMEQEAAGLSKFQDPAKPARRLGEWLQIKKETTESIVEKTMEEVKSHSIHDSTARSTRSGLRLWHDFAMDLLDYDPGCTLPPKRGAHVVKYVYWFHNHGTCARYITFLRWACANKDCHT